MPTIIQDDASMLSRLFGLSERLSHRIHRPIISKFVKNIIQIMPIPMSDAVNIGSIV